MMMNKRRPLAAFAPPFQREADAVAAGLEAQRDTNRFIAKIRGDSGDGDELFYELRAQFARFDRPEAYQRAFCRVIQKELERAA